MISKSEKQWYLVFLLPALAVLILITFGPFLYSIWLSFHQWRLATRGGPQFVGLQNYLRMLRDMRFFGAMHITAIMLVLCLAVQIPLGFTLALLLYSEGPARKLLRTLILLPMMITPIVAALMWQMMLNNEYGSARHILNVIGIQNVPIWLGEPTTALATLVVVDTWQWAPMVVLFVLAGLNSLPNHYFEAAQLEGARIHQTILMIIFPVLKPVITLVAILRGIDVIRMFDVIFVLTRGGPGTSTETITFYTYRQAFGFFDMGYAATLSLMILIISIILSSKAIQFLRNGIASGR